MLKYLVGTFNEIEGTFAPPFIIVHARNRTAACIFYDTHLKLVPPAGRVMALVSLYGPFNYDAFCNHAKAVEALANVSEELK